MLYPRVEHQAVLAVVVVVVGPLVVRPYHTRRDAVRLLRQPAVFIVTVQVMRVFGDAVTRLYGLTLWLCRVLSSADNQRLTLTGCGLHCRQALLPRDRHLALETQR